MQLGYLVFEVRDMPRWHGFMTAVLGFVDVGAGRYRMDGHAWRIQLVEGPADDLAALAWEADDDVEFDQVAARLSAAGVAVEEGDAQEVGASRRLRFVDPAGVPTELVVGLAMAADAFASPLVPDGFVADTLGLGHLVLTTSDKASSERFYADLFGAKLSDQIVTTFHGFQVDLSFYHLNARHHSVAFGGPQKKRLHHFLIEVRDMEEVGRCFDRCLRSGVRLFQTIGRHPNDRMFSFYAFTPSGFQFEYGWGGRLVDDATWSPEIYDRISEWGHAPVGLLAGERR